MFSRICLSTLILKTPLSSVHFLSALFFFLLNVYCLAFFSLGKGHAFKILFYFVLNVTSSRQRSGSGRLKNLRIRNTVLLAFPKWYRDRMNHFSRWFVKIVSDFRCCLLGINITLGRNFLRKFKCAVKTGVVFIENRWSIFCFVHNTRIHAHCGEAKKSFKKPSVADPDPGSGIGCLFDPWIRDGRKSSSGSGMNNPDHIF